MKQLFDFAGATATLLSACCLLLGTPAPASAQSTTSIHLTLGNPSRATSEAANRTNYLMAKPQYALSYNDATKTANWVSWQLNPANLGGIRVAAVDFNADSTLPSGWYRVTGDEYAGSSFVHGQMTPATDRSDTSSNNAATFLMTNVVPLAPDVASGPWKELEEYCRELVRQGKELYIISGGYGSGGTVPIRDKGDTITDFQNSTEIIVPAYIWKVIVVLDRPGQGLAGVNTSTQVIAVDMPNAQGIRNSDWRSYRVSVDTVEARTGFDFLSDVSADIQAVIESGVDLQ